MNEYKRFFLAIILFFAGVIMAQTIQPPAIHRTTVIQNKKSYTILYRFINNDSEVEITSGRDRYDSSYEEYAVIPNTFTQFTIPAIINERPVTKIGDYAFSYCKNLTSIIIPARITEIGEGAFHGCSALSKVTLGKNLTALKIRAFSECSKLTSIEIPDNVTLIGGGAFKDCSSLSNVIFGKNVATIGNEAFRYCVELTSIEIPDSVTFIGSEAFSYCEKLVSFKIGLRLARMGQHVFGNCENLIEVFFKAKPPVFTYSIYNWKNENVINYITEEYADFWQSENGSFKDFGGIGYCRPVLISKELIITFLSNDGKTPKKVQQQFMRHQTINLKLNEFIEKEKNFIGWKAQETEREYSNNEFVSFTDNVVLVAQWENIVYTALSHQNGENYTILYSLINNGKEIEITSGKNNISAISPNNFAQFTIPAIINGKTVTKIGDFAFWDCQELTSIIILNNKVKEIGKSTFSKCNALKSVEFSANIEKIGDDAFAQCTALTSVFFNGKSPRVGSNIYKDVNENLKNYITERNAKFWSKTEEFFDKIDEKPVEVFGTRVLTFLSNDTTKAKKTTQKFMQHQGFCLSINKFKERDKIFSGWKLENTGDIFYDGVQTSFADNVSLVAQWETVSKDNCANSLNKNFIGGIVANESGIGKVEFSINKNGNVTGKTITQFGTYAFSSNLVYENSMIIFKFTRSGQQDFIFTYNQEGNDSSMIWTGYYKNLDGKSGAIAKCNLVWDVIPMKINYTAILNLSDVLVGENPLKIDLTTGTIIGTVTADIKANVKTSLIMLDGLTVNLSGKLTANTETHDTVIFFSSLYSKKGYIYLEVNVNRSDFSVLLTGNYVNGKPNTLNYQANLTGRASIYLESKFKDVVRDGDYNLKLDAKSLEKIPPYSAPIKISKFTVYELVNCVEKLPNVMLFYNNEKRKLELKEKTAAPFYNNVINTWIYEGSNKGKVISDANVTTFLFSSKTGLYSGNFNVYYDYYENHGTENSKFVKHFVVKVPYKGAVIYDSNGVTGSANALISTISYQEDNFKQNKFSKFSGKQPLTISIIKN